MEGDLTRSTAVGARPLRIRPHWWAVLAVSLSLLALVAATTAERPSGPGDRRADGVLRSGRNGSSAIPSSAPPTVAKTPTSTVTPSTTVTPSPTVPVVSTPIASDNARATVRSPVTTTTTTTRPTGVPSATNGSSALAAGSNVPPVQTVTQTGDLQQPDDATASYAFTGSGAMLIAASWPSAVPLSMTVICPDGTESAQGSANVAVTIPDADGPCDVSLKETLVQYDTVSYTLTIGPSEGG